jgi:hypothetical protein
LFSLKGIKDDLAAQTHTTAQIVGLDTALAGKALTAHTHTTAQVTGLDTALAGKAATTHDHNTVYVAKAGGALTGKLDVSTSLTARLVIPVGVDKWAT